MINDYRPYEKLDEIPLGRFIISNDGMERTTLQNAYINIQGKIDLSLISRGRLTIISAENLLKYYSFNGSEFCGVKK